jgi:hypothetical protein
MYCPKCGQSQVNDGVRFCSRCGFLLEGVSNLLASAGQLPVMYDENTGGHMSPRRRGARKGATLVMLGIFFVPLFFFFHELIGTPEELPLVGLLFILAASCVCSSRAFLKKARGARLHPHRHSTCRHSMRHHA